VVSAGSEASNHIQALSRACRCFDLMCDLTLYPVPGGWYDPTLRLQGLEATGAVVHRIEHAELLSRAMSNSMDVLVQQGYKTFYWHSDGDPVYAIPSYLKACERFLSAWGRNGEVARAREPHRGPEQVYLATGTGLTLTGLRLGLPISTALHGLSIARDTRRIEADVAFNLQQFDRRRNKVEITEPIVHRPLNRLQVYDTHRKGGYGRIDKDLMRLSRELTERSGIEFDPIYTAKAYAGMCALLDRQAHETVVFWHTGPRTMNVIPQAATS
jgi:1-aminocyclopropane-1-carboxylate deaminase/D-cysteine desulfhydrase-like pyridoxal-dependent ACC family enzyme